MLINEIADYLGANHIGTLEVDLFLMLMSDSPDNQICLRQTGGLPVAGKHGDVDYDIQVLVRDLDVEKGYRRIMQIFDILCKEDRSGIFLTAVNRRIICTPNQYPFPLTYDEKNRHVWDFNMTVLSKREVM